MGPLLLVRTAKIVATSVLCVLGAILLIVSFIMYRKFKASRYLDAVDNYDNMTEEEGLNPAQKIERRQIRIQNDSYDPSTIRGGNESSIFGR